MLQRLRIDGYRSIRHFDLALKRVNVICGPNGCGKTNLYSAIELLVHAASGRLAQSIAAGGGMRAALWAGSWKRSERHCIEITAEFEDFSYELSIGLPPPESDPPPRDPTAFSLDPLVKFEQVRCGTGRAAATLVERDHGTARLRDENCRMQHHPTILDDNQSVLSQLREPQRLPELVVLRERFAAWRFYHHFRTDAAAPTRQPQIPVRTPSLAADGGDLVSALRTIHEFGDAQRLRAAVEAVLPNWSFGCGGEGLFLQFLPPMLEARYFTLRDASDGMMRYLCLVAALLSVRPPELLVLNEPESSLHPRLLPDLAELIAGIDCQVWVATHSMELARLIADRTGENFVELEMIKGATRIKHDDE